MSLNAVNGVGNNLMNAFKTGIQDNTAAEEAQDSKTTKLETSTAKASKEPSFLEKFVSATTKSKPKPSLETMQDSLAALRAKGKVILHHPIQESVSSYIKELKDFLGDIRDHAYESKTRDEHFQGIAIADTKLDALAEDLLDTEKSELALIDSLGALQGLIIDVYA